MLRIRKFGFRAAVIAAPLLIAVGCGNTVGGTSDNGNSTQARRLPVVALPGYNVSVFTAADSRLTVSNPDAVAADGGHVFIAYQNSTPKDCTDNTTSTVVEYDMKGAILRHWDVPGHTDGMRIDPSTHLIWTTSCEDGNAKFATLDPNSGQQTAYKFPTAPHGGGYDDLFFLNGAAFVAASNPSLTSSGSNPFPAVDKISLGTNGDLKLTPVLMGNSTAADLLNKNAPTQLTLTDPDSLSVDNTGQLVLVSQGDSELVFIQNPESAKPRISKLTVGTQLDDTVWPTGAGRLLVVDGKSGVTYWIRGNFAAGDIYTQAPDDSGVANFVGTIDPTTGFVTPVAVGFAKATGMAFVPNS